MFCGSSWKTVACTIGRIDLTASTGSEQTPNLDTQTDEKLSLSCLRWLGPMIFDTAATQLMLKTDNMDQTKKLNNHWLTAGSNFAVQQQQQQQQQTSASSCCLGRSWPFSYYCHTSDTITLLKAVAVGGSQQRRPLGRNTAAPADLLWWPHGWSQTAQFSSFTETLDSSNQFFCFCFVLLLARFILYSHPAD